MRKPNSVLLRTLALQFQLMWRRSKTRTVFFFILVSIPGFLSALSVPALEGFIHGIEAAAQGAGWSALIFGAVLLCGVNRCSLRARR